jgi:hypothetical protein
MTALAMLVAGCGGETLDGSPSTDVDTGATLAGDGSVSVDAAAETASTPAPEAGGTPAVVTGADAAGVWSFDAAAAPGEAGSAPEGGGPGSDATVDSGPVSDFAPDGGVVGDATVIGPPTIGNDGYLIVDAGSTTLLGYVGSYIGGSSSSITLTYGSTAFCASGTVAPNSTYQSYAGAGFNVNQAQSSTGGASSPLELSGTSMTLSFENFAGSPLRVQIIDASDNYWCVTLTQTVGPITIPMSSFNTQCWNDGGQSFQPGTDIAALQLIVPGSDVASTPFNFCFLGVTIQ